MEADNIYQDYETKYQSLAGDLGVAIYKNGVDKIDSLSTDMNNVPIVRYPPVERYSGFSISLDDFFCNSSCRAKRNAEAQAIAAKAESDRRLAEATQRLAELEAEKAKQKVQSQLPLGTKVGLAVGGVVLVLVFLKGLVTIKKAAA